MGQVKEQPVAFIVAATEAYLRPAGSVTPLRAQPGDILFNNDTLLATDGRVTFSFCSEAVINKTSYTLEGDVTLTGRAEPVVSRGRFVSSTALKLCSLPEMERRPESSTVPPLREIAPQPADVAVIRSAVQRLPDEHRIALESVITADRQAPHVRFTRAALFQRASRDDRLSPEQQERLKLFAAEDLAALAATWTEQPRLNKLVSELMTTRTGTRMLTELRGGAKPRTGPGVKHALVIGISKYEQPNIPNLNYADDDANQFAEYLLTPRGGVRKENLTVLTDNKATSAAIRNHFVRLTEAKTRPRPEDTVVIYIAAHGKMIAPREGEPEVPHVVTYRSNAQDLKINGVAMTDIQQLMLGNSAPFALTLVFLDVCHAGQVAVLQTPPRAAANAKRRPGDPNYLGLLATHQGPDAAAYENAMFGGGHGVFTYFLLRALNTREAVEDPGATAVTAADLSVYLREKVSYATRRRQIPTDAIGTELAQEIANLSAKGIERYDATGLDRLRIPWTQLSLPKGRRGREYEKGAAARAQRDVKESELMQRIAAEEEGEEVLLQYLKGDEIPQTQADFLRGARYFVQALSTQPGSHYLEARRDFCEGRAAVFARNYATARTRLERSIRLDPSAAYAYNALGISYLEQGQYETAILAFQDAIARAPAWAYPRHNLALALTERGDYEAAIREYKEAAILAPSYSYVPYNLGLLYQRMNLRNEAEAAYRHAAQLRPDRAEPYTALGLLYALQGKYDKAKHNYEIAVSKPNQPPLTEQVARHNYAVLLARRPATLQEALRLWQKNGSYVPSLFSLAEASSAGGQTTEAIHWYREVLCLMPNHAAARIALASELANAAEFGEAIRELQQVALEKPHNANILRRIGDVQAKSGQHQAALESYTRALALKDPAEQRRLRDAIKKLPKVRQ